MGKRSITLLKLLLFAGSLYFILVALQATLFGIEVTQIRATRAAESAALKYANAEPRATEKLKTPPPPIKNAKATVVERVATKTPQIFITIDDGVTPDRAGLDLMKERRATATLFLNNANIHRYYNYFKEWQAAGSTIQNHTDMHRHLPSLAVDAQKREVCTHGDRFTQVFGTRPTFFRPPFGEFNEDTLKIASECGQKYVVLWSAVVEDGLISYADGATGLRAGDIVLLHFTPELAKDLTAVFDAANAAHLKIGRLEDTLR